MNATDIRTAKRLARVERMLRTIRVCSVIAAVSWALSWLGALLIYLKARELAEALRALR